MNSRSNQKKHGFKEKLTDLFASSGSSNKSSSSKASRRNQSQTWNAAPQPVVNDPRTQNFIAPGSMHFGYATDARSASQNRANRANRAPTQPVARGQYQRQVPQYRQVQQYRYENNVSPVSFSAERRPVSPLFTTPGSSSAAGSSFSRGSRPQRSDALSVNSPVRRMNAVRRPSNRERSHHPGLTDAPVNRNHTVLPTRDVRRKKAQTFDQPRRD